MGEIGTPLLSNRLPWVCVLIGLQGWSGAHDSKKTLAAYIVHVYSLLQSTSHS